MFLPTLISSNPTRITSIHLPLDLINLATFLYNFRVQVYEMIIIMSKRLHPYRKSAPPDLLDLLKNLPRLYLAGITGYTSFILQDLYSRKYKITIGNQLKCSCSSQRNDHCAHTLYILTEVFYIAHSDPLVWQTSYLNQQLRYMVANNRIKQNKITEFLKFVRPAYYKKDELIVEESDEDEDNLCAICNQQMVRRDLITKCVAGCKNRFHLQCFKQWAEHRAKSKLSINCPLCRDQKDQKFMMSLVKKEVEKKQEDISKKVGVEFNFYCEGCQLKEIGDNQDAYKCIFCEDFILCSGCFDIGKHIKHSFIVKKSGSNKWTMTPDRKGKVKIDEDSSLVRIKITEPKLLNFLASSLPCFFSKTKRWNAAECRKLDMTVEDLQCSVCEDKQKSFLRKLPCGHFAHHRCLRKRVEKGKFFCKVDGQKYLMGYQNLVEHQKIHKFIESSPKKYQKRQGSIEDIEEQIQQEDERGKKLKTQKSTSLDQRDPSRGRSKKKHSMSLRKKIEFSKSRLNYSGQLQDSISEAH